MHLVPPDINIDFVGMRYKAAVLSLIAVVTSLLLFFGVGPTWGIDFTGGTEVRVQFQEPTDIGDVRDSLSGLNIGSDAVQQYGAPDDNEFTIRIQDTTVGTEDLQDEVSSLLAAKYGADWIQESAFDAQVGARMTVRYAGPEIAVAEIEESLRSVDGARVRQALDDNTIYVELPGLTSKIAQSISDKLAGRQFEIRNVDSVGPKVGDELKKQGALAILATLALILVYVGFRFDLAFAPGAVLALFHDVTIVCGAFVVFDKLGWRHEFNLPMIGALLTIIGYSLNDTIVIYDRIRENMKRYRRRDTGNLINASVNETLSRTLATSMTTAMAMMAFLVLGGDVIETFALAILMGVFVGTYSTVFIASPTILLMEDIRPWFDRVFAPSAAQATAAAGAGGPQTRSERRRMEREARRRGDEMDDEG